MLEETEDAGTLGRAYLLAAYIEHQEGQVQDGRRHVELAEELLGPSPEPVDGASLLVLESLLDDDPVRSAELARQAMDLLGDFHPSERAAAARALAAALARQGDIEQASAAYGSAVDLFSLHGRRADAAVACREWAAMLRAAGRTEQAENVLCRAEDFTHVRTVA